MILNTRTTRRTRHTGNHTSFTDTQGTCSYMLYLFYAAAGEGALPFGGAGATFAPPPPIDTTPVFILWSSFAIAHLAFSSLPFCNISRSVLIEHSFTCAAA